MLKENQVKMLARMLFVQNILVNPDTDPKVKAYELKHFKGIAKACFEAAEVFEQVSSEYKEEKGNHE